MFNSKQHSLLQKILDIFSKGAIEELQDQRNIEAGKIFKIKTDNDEFLILKYAVEPETLKVKFNELSQLKLYTKIWQPMVVKSKSKVETIPTIFIHKEDKFFSVFESDE